MLVLAIAGILIVLILISLWRYNYPLSEKVFACLIGGSFFALVLWFISITILSHTTGLNPDYGHGEVVGRMVKLEYRGLIYQTWEGEIELGPTHQASTSNTIRFTVDTTDDEEMLNKIKESVGKDVRVNYKTWFTTPYRIGTSNNVVTNVRSQ